MRRALYVCAAIALGGANLTGCAHGARTVPAPGVHTAAAVTMPMPPSISPARVAAPPMARTTLLPGSTMSARKPQSDISMLGWTQLSGAAVFVTASPDGSLWALSTLGNGADHYIYHNVGGTWTNVPGAASRLAVARDGTLWAVNSAGGIYTYTGSTWTQLAGGASDIAIASDNTVYVVSNQAGNQYGNGIWHYAHSAWTQVNGAGTRIAASWDASSYPGGIVPGGLYVINALQSIYYYNPASGFTQLPGGAVQVAPTRSGGLFALGLTSNAAGSSVYYDDLNTSSWTQQPGAGTSVTTDGIYVYVTGTAGGIYYAPVNAHHITGNGTALTGPDYSPGTNGGWGPTIVANSFNFPVQSGFDGSGATVAIVIDATVSTSDLSAYFSYFKTPATNRQITVVPIDDPVSNADALESTLDVETVAGLAPGANVTLYYIPGLSKLAENDAYNAILADGKATIVSSSYGGCEVPTLSSQIAQSAIYQAGANQGVTFIASSGDNGEECFYGRDNLNHPIFHFGVNYPSSDPNVIGVGGTETELPNNALTSTAAWNDFFFNSGQGSTGGGVSTSFTLPSYQSGIAGLSSATMRNVPDIALPAVSDGIYLNGGWHLVGGTSWSAPMFAAMLAEVYQYCNASFTDPVSLPYFVYETAGSGAFRDVTTGNNQFASDATYFTAQAGYDNVSGLGVPLGVPFAQTICPNRVPLARARRPMARTALTQRGPTQAYAADVVPHSAGLVDRGARAPAAVTRIQVVLRPTASVASDERAVIAVLQSAGFTVAKTFSNHLVVDADGPSSAVGALFATQLHDVVQDSYPGRYMPVAPATIPASLAPYVAGVTLDNIITGKHR
jgi:Tectonin domain